MNNNTMLSDNKTVLLDNNVMLLDIHRNVVAGQEGKDLNRNQSVSTTFYCFVNKSVDGLLDSSQVSGRQHHQFKILLPA